MTDILTTQLRQVDTISQHPHNPRHVAEPSQELIDSIHAHGILQPLVIVKAGLDNEPTPETDWWVLCGHRRLAAAREADLEHVPVIVNDEAAGSLARQLEIMLIENLQRSDLTPVEEADAYQQLTLYGHTADIIATNTGRSETTIRRRLRLAGMATNIKTAVHDRQLTLETADRIAALEDHRDLYTTVMEAFNTDDFDYELHRAEIRLKAIKTATEFTKNNPTLHRWANREEVPEGHYFLGNVIHHPSAEPGTDYDGYYIDTFHNIILTCSDELWTNQHPETPTNSGPTVDPEKEAAAEAERAARQERETIALAAHLTRLNHAFANVYEGDRGPLLAYCLAVIFPGNREPIEYLRDQHGFEYDSNTWAVTFTELHTFLKDQSETTLLKALLFHVIPHDALERPLDENNEYTHWISPDTIRAALGFIDFNLDHLRYVPPEYEATFTTALENKLEKS